MKQNIKHDKKHHYIRNGDLIKDYEDGGIKATDCEFMNRTLKIKGLRSFLRNDDKMWFSLPSLVSNKVGGSLF